jgi:hypothetical protein
MEQVRGGQVHSIWRLNELRRKIPVNLMLELGGRRPSPVNEVLEWVERSFFIIFWGDFFCTIFNTASSAADSTVPTDAGIEPRTVATGVLAVRRSNH